jgi:hypothetical protein
MFGHPDKDRVDPRHDLFDSSFSPLATTFSPLCHVIITAITAMHGHPDRHQAIRTFTFPSNLYSCASTGYIIFYDFTASLLEENGFCLGPLVGWDSGSSGQFSFGVSVVEYTFILSFLLLLPGSAEWVS